MQWVVGSDEKGYAGSQVKLFAGGGPMEVETDGKVGGAEDDMRT